jgi:hypothetical protein
VRLTGRVARMGHVKFLQNLTKREGEGIYRPRYRWESDDEMIRRDFGLELLISCVWLRVDRSENSNEHVGCT